MSVTIACFSNNLSRENLQFAANGFFCSPYAPSHALPVNLSATCAATVYSSQLQDQPFRVPGKLDASFPGCIIQPVSCLISFIYERKITVFVSLTNVNSCTSQNINPQCFTTFSCMSLFLFWMFESKYLLLHLRMI